MHDCSWAPQVSVNNYTLQYIKFDDIIFAVKSQGVHSNMAKLDLASAFKQILVKKDQWQLLGFTMNSFKGLDYIILISIWTLIRYTNGVSYVCH